MAVLYDIYFLFYKLKIKRSTVGRIFGFMVLFNTYLLHMYHHDPFSVVTIATITQLSDVYQYIAGKHFGKNKIGWISKNKTYEGYIVGLIFTLGTFLPLHYFSGYTVILGNFISSITCSEADKVMLGDEVFSMDFFPSTTCSFVNIVGSVGSILSKKGFWEIFWIYTLGIVSGLCSSYFKRIQGIKDYSDLLGPHGGWIDRIDSIILPSMVLGFF
jgi:CDP-diglyceride synthetase